MESCKDLVALGRKEFIGQRGGSVFWRLFEGSDLYLQHWPEVDNSHGAEEVQEAQAACRSISVGAQGFWQLLCLEGAPKGMAVPSTATHHCCMFPEIREIPQEEASAGALTCFEW